MLATKSGSVAFMLLCVALAGCASGGDGGGAAVGPGGGSDGEGAALQVLVTDDSLVPLESAVVQVRETQAQATTDTKGVASFRLNESGTFTVDAQKLGYESQSKRVDVPATGEAVIEFQLAPIEVVEAFHATILYQGFMACGGGLMVVSFTSGCQDSNHQVAFEQTVTPDLATVVSEMTWEQNTALSAQELRLTLWQNPNCDPVCDPDHEYADEVGPSPLYVRSDGDFDGISEENEPDENNLTHQIWTPAESDEPPFVVLVIQQPFEIHATYFYGEEAPEGFSARPDV